MIDLKNFPYPVVHPSFTMDLNRMANLNPANIEYCVWHHVGGAQDDNSTAEQTNNFHRTRKGWAGIGYHGQIRHNGQLELGRPFSKCGVHASAVNSKSIGFCLSGNFELVDIMTRVNQYKSAVELAIRVSKAFPKIKHVPHREVGSTACNGRRFPWAQFMKDVEAGLKAATAPPPAPAPTPPPSSNTLFRVQTGAFSVRANADRLEAQLKQKGYQTYMVQDGKLFKVQVGAFANRQNAENLADKLKKDGFDAYITTNSGTPVAPSPAPKPTPPPPPQIRVGSRVRIRSGAKTYTGGSLASFVYNRIYTVSELRNDRAVITYGGQVVAAMNIKDLYLA